MFTRQIKLDAREAENDRLRSELHHIHTRAADLTEENQHLKQRELLLQRSLDQLDADAEDELQRVRWSVRDTMKQLLEFKKVVDDLGAKVDAEVRKLSDRIEVEARTLGAACLR